MKKLMLTLILVILVISPLAAVSGEKGWTELFNGKDLAGWTTSAGDDLAGKTQTEGKDGPGWVFEKGVLVRKSKSGYIWTKKRYGDFILDVEVNTTGNSGIFFRTDNIQSCVQTGIEMQVLPEGGPDQITGFGSIYNCLAPSKKVGGPGWHRVIITCKDNLITIAIDGEQVIDMDLNKWDTPQKNPDGSKNKFKTALKDFKREGHIGIQDHGKLVQYRNMKIKELN